MHAVSRGNALPIIRASEIGQHAFCARSWWLGRVEGYPSSNVQQMDFGQRSHEMHGRLVAHSHRLQGLALTLLLLAALAGMLGLYLLLRAG